MQFSEFQLDSSDSIIQIAFENAHLKIFFNYLTILHTNSINVVFPFSSVIIEVRVVTILSNKLDNVIKVDVYYQRMPFRNDHMIERMRKE